MIVKIRFNDIIKIASKYSCPNLERMILPRDIIQVSLFHHEFLYPLAQGYDSITKSDLELGGRSKIQLTCLGHYKKNIDKILSLLSQLLC